MDAHAPATLPASSPSGSPITSDDLARIRAQLPAISASTYLNAGTLGPLPEASVVAMQAEHRYDVERRQCERLWERLAQLQDEARGALTSLTGVGADQVALMHTTHEGLNTCLWGLDLQAGDRVVTTDEEHPGLLVPLHHLRDRTGCDVRTVAWGADDAAFVDGILAQVDARTRAVALSHVSWVSGRIAPLRELRDALPDGCRIVVDGAQSAGVLAVDPSDGWDAYTVSGQKWPCGPNGSGGLALVDPEAWLPTFGAFLQVEQYDDPLGSPIRHDGRRFETSQEAMAPLAGFRTSVDWLVTEVGTWRARAHARALNAHARVGLRGVLAAATGTDDVAAERDCCSGEDHLLCVCVPTGRAPEVATELCRQGIVIRNLGEDRIRLSLGCWTSVEEVDAAIEAIERVLA